MTKPFLTRRTLLTGVIALVAAGIAAAALYCSGAVPGNSDRQAAAACPASRALAMRIAPLAKGEVAALAVQQTPRPAVDLAFQDREGKPVTLADFRGRTVLLNLWATWCAPCRHEMPALDKLQAELGGPDFEVVTVNIDQRNLDRPKAWLTENGIQRLAYYSDPSVKVFQDLKGAGKAFGMPVTLLIDRDGCELGLLNGPAEWASADAVALVKAALGR